MRSFCLLAAFFSIGNSIIAVIGLILRSQSTNFKSYESGINVLAYFFFIGAYYIF